jgi:hypothetical protein
MRTAMAGIVLGSLVTALNASAGSAVTLRTETVNCENGPHTYTMCPYYNYCFQDGGVEACKQICTNQQSNPNVSSEFCFQFGTCEVIQCTFGGPL